MSTSNLWDDKSCVGPRSWCGTWLSDTHLGPNPCELVWLTHRQTQQTHNCHSLQDSFICITEHCCDRNDAHTLSCKSKHSRWRTQMRIPRIRAHQNEWFCSLWFKLSGVPLQHAKRVCKVEHCSPTMVDDASLSSSLVLSLSSSSVLMKLVDHCHELSLGHWWWCQWKTHQLHPSFQGKCHSCFWKQCWFGSLIFH